MTLCASVSGTASTLNSAIPPTADGARHQWSSGFGQAALGHEASSFHH